MKFDIHMKERGVELNKLLLHLEGTAVFILSVYGYYFFDYNFLLFIIFLFVPDIAMFGYMVNRRVGAIIYNIIHTYVLSFATLLLGFITNMELLIIMGLIWTAHIGMDRMFGFGLKYPTQFNDTHLNRV